MSGVISYGARRLTSPHQKCDAQRPCTTCVKRDRGTRCTYEPQQRSRPTAPKPSTNRYPEPQTGPPSDLLLTRSDSNESSHSPPPSSAACERSSSPTVRLLWELSPRIYEQIGLGPPSNVSIVQNVRGTAECVPRLAGFSFTIPPSTHLQTRPRPLRVPLSLIPPEYAQVSSIAESELAMTWYVFFSSYFPGRRY